MLEHKIIAWSDHRCSGSKHNFWPFCQIIAAVAKYRDWRLVTKFFAKKKNAELSQKTHYFFGSGHCVSDHNSKMAAADFWGVAVVHRADVSRAQLLLFRCGRKRPKLKKNDERKRMT